MKFQLIKIQAHISILAPIAVFLLIILGCPCLAQKTACVCNVRGNILFIGIENHLTAMVEGIDCDSLIITTDNGMIKEYGCGLTIQVDGKTESSIQICYTVKGDTINAGITKFRVNPLPPPNIAVANRYYSDSIEISQITKTPYMTACLMNFDISIGYSIKSFSTIILRNNTCIFSEKNMGQKLSENLMSFLSQCRTGDRLIFCAAEVYGPMGEEKVVPVEYILKQ